MNHIGYILKGKSSLSSSQNKPDIDFLLEKDDILINNSCSLRDLNTCSNSQSKRGNFQKINRSRFDIPCIFGSQSIPNNCFSGNLSTFQTRTDERKTHINHKFLSFYRSNNLLHTSSIFRCLRKSQESSTHNWLNHLKSNICNSEHLQGRQQQIQSKRK